MADRPPADGAQAVVSWMLHEGRRHTRMREFGDALCGRMVAAGIPLWRAFCGVRTLHPQIAATAYFWYREGDGTGRVQADYATSDSPQFRNSPVVAVQESGAVVRRRLEDPTVALDYEILSEFKAGGGTDYVAMPMVFSSGQCNSVSWTTDRPGGFTAADIAGLHDITEMLAIIVELQANRRISRSLMNTYVGRRTGERVLSGAITRGSGETVSAVVWYCDLRAFTTLTDTLPPDQLIALLNYYFEIMADAITAEGGEVLKFIGDAMLAIFELAADGDVAERCAAALTAAANAATALAANNAERQTVGAPQIAYGLALHLGEVVYGNIGARDRLDFTVIGPAVNHAARLEKLSANLGRTIVTSESFAAAAAQPLDDLGTHALRGVEAPQRVFAPPAPAAVS